MEHFFVVLASLLLTAPCDFFPPNPIKKQPIFQSLFYKSSAAIAAVAFTALFVMDALIILACDDAVCLLDSRSKMLALEGFNGSEDNNDIFGFKDFCRISPAVVVVVVVAAVSEEMLEGVSASAVSRSSVFSKSRTHNEDKSDKD